MTLTPSSRKPIPIKHRRRQARTPNVASNPFSCSPLRGKGTRVFQYNLPDVLFGELAGGGLRQFVNDDKIIRHAPLGGLALVMGTHFGTAKFGTVYRKSVVSEKSVSV